MKKLATILFLVVSLWSCQKEEVSIDQAPKTLYHSIKDSPHLEVIKRNVASLLSTDNVRTDQDFLELLNWEKVRIESFDENAQIYALGYLIGDNKLKNVFITEMEGNLTPYYIEMDQALFQSSPQDDIDDLDPQVKVINLLSNQEWTFASTTTNSSGRLMVVLNCSYELTIEEWQGVNYSAGGVSYSEPEVTYTIELVCDGGSGGGGDPISGGSGGGSGREIPVVTELCPEGYVWVENDCYPVCSEEAAYAYIELCEPIPCTGDPVVNPQIAPSCGSGKPGGTYGCTRLNSEKTCGGVKGRKKHDGIDIAAPLNSYVHAMYSGTVIAIRNTFSPGQYKRNSYGNYVIIQSIINGKTRKIKYNHLNQVQVDVNDEVVAGNVIGVSGNTGNANSANVVPHVHIQVFNAAGTSQNPEDYLKTKFDENKNTIEEDCS